jgi:hypothetical protein
MKRLPDNRDIQIPLNSGVLDGRFPAGTGETTDFRLLVNVGTMDERGRSRLPGWTARRSASPSNEDLHDQLAWVPVVAEDGTVTYTEGDATRDVITTLADVTASTGARYGLAATRSRIYATTGQGRNWRLLADGLNPGAPVWPRNRVRIATGGDMCLFSNGVDAILAWPMGGGVLTTGPNAARAWAAWEVYDLLGLGVNRAGCIAAWGGFAFLGDVTVNGDQYGSRVYWSDFNRPLEWAPGGESAAGYVDLGRGEQVLRLEPLGGQLRCYTDRAIYSVELVGGETVFLFREIYRGDLALAFQDGFVNMGNSHLWLTRESVVLAGEYDKVPVKYEWLHRAAGFIFNGLDGRWLNDCPVPFTGFGPIDTARCYGIVCGWDGALENAWISWPTTTEDAADPDGAKRMTLIISPRYNKATLVDYGFSAFAQMRPQPWKSIRDFLLEQGVGIDAFDSELLLQREGAPLNTITTEAEPPRCLWNATEDPTLPMDEDHSLAARVQNVYLSADCAACVPSPVFCMASARDRAIKQFDVNSRSRETLTGVASASDRRPEVGVADYTEEGYLTLIQGEIHKFGTGVEKTVTRVGLVYDAETQAEPGKVNVQLGVSNSPHCVEWWNSRPVTMDCLKGNATDDGKLRQARPASFPYYRAGAWLCYRIFVGEAADGYEPTGSGGAFNELIYAAQIKNETWRNQ